MARIIVMIILSILCVAVIAFGIYDVFIQGNNGTSNIFRIIIIMAGLAMSWVKILRPGRRGTRNLEFYRKSYADIVDNTFVKDEKSFKQLLKSTKYFNENKHKKAPPWFLSQSCICAKDHQESPALFYAYFH